jgi:hypothetical protein
LAILRTDVLSSQYNGFDEDIFGQARPFLDQRCRYSINQPVLQDPDAADAAFGPPSPAREIRRQVDIEGNPFQQIFHRSHKGCAFFFVLYVIAGKMNISPTASQLPTRIAKPALL